MQHPYSRSSANFCFKSTGNESVVTATERVSWFVEITEPEDSLFYLLSYFFSSPFWLALTNPKRLLLEKIMTTIMHVVSQLEGNMGKRA